MRGGLNFQHLHYITIAVCCHFFPFIITISIYITFSVTFSMYFHYDRGHFFLVLKLVSKQGNMPLQFVTWSYDVLMCVCETRAGGQAYINISAAFSVCYYYRDHSKYTWSGRGKGVRLLPTIVVHQIRVYIGANLTPAPRSQSVAAMSPSPAAVCGGGVFSVTRASSGQASDQQVAAITPQHLNTLNNVNSVSLVSLILPVSQYYISVSPYQHLTYIYISSVTYCLH